MSTVILFVSTVIIWGTSWIAIAAQIGDVPITVSVFYRFALAAVLMIAGLAVIGRLRRPSIWRFVILQALCLFCLNFIALYNATALITSGLVSVVFSLASIFNAFNARIFFGERVSLQTLIAGALGATGLILLFWRDLAVTVDLRTLQGLGWAILGTMVFSWGNMASRRNTGLGITPLTANAWGMGIGALTLLPVIISSGQTLTAPQDKSYWLALIYLSVAASIIAFTTYLSLVARLGSAKAGYATVLFPVVALSASAVFEGYVWTATSIAGASLAVLGNVVMFTGLWGGPGFGQRSGSEHVRSTAERGTK